MDGEERRAGAYTWLSERESGERLKASDEGAGMGGGCVCVCVRLENWRICWRSEARMEVIYSSDFALRRIGRDES